MIRSRFFPSGLNENKVSGISEKHVGRLGMGSVSGESFQISQVQVVKYFLDYVRIFYLCDYPHYPLFGTDQRVDFIDLPI